jgi:ATP-dependent RNA helicase SUPV3L1/SUV3
VLDASKALEAANASGDVQKIKAAMSALDAALRGQAQAAAAVEAAGPAMVAPAAEAPAGSAAGEDGASDAAIEGSADSTAAATTSSDDVASDSGSGDAGSDGATAQPAVPPKPAPKPVIAMRGDDRPGMKKSEPAAAGRGGKFGDRKGGPGGKFGERRDGPRDARGDARFGGGRFGERPAREEDRGPRLGDVAFRAQREALEHAQMALKKLAAQAHGEALTQLMTAWEQRSPDQVPTQQELGKAVAPSIRSSWVKALGAPPAADGSEALLRLEIAAEAPTPAEHLDARRALQLKLLTKRNDPSPAQTWGEDAAAVLASAYDAGIARRLQTVLKTLLRR